MRWTTRSTMNKRTPARSGVAKPAPRPADPRRNDVRIIGGQWKRTRLAVADKPGLRPTPDRVRETLFNWLASLAGAGGGELPDWHCIDAFAGTGALGFEAASRGAASVLLCEQDAALVAQLRLQSAWQTPASSAPAFGSHGVTARVQRMQAAQPPRLSRRGRMLTGAAVLGVAAFAAALQPAFSSDVAPLALPVPPGATR